MRGDRSLGLSRVSSLAWARLILQRGSAETARGKGYALGERRSFKRRHPPDLPTHEAEIRPLQIEGKRRR